MAYKRNKMKGRRESGTFIMLPHAVIDNPNFIALSPYAVKLLIDLYGRYNGYNNGDFCAAWSLMEKRGWRSKATLQKALKELLERGFIMTTRQGGRKVATLYAVTFKDIDECQGKLDVRPGPAPGIWRDLPQTHTNTADTTTQTSAEKTISLPQIPAKIARNNPNPVLQQNSTSLH